MTLSTRRSTSRIDICDYSTLLYREYDTNINLTKNYFLSQSPPPMTYRDLRSVISNKIPSNIVILPESVNSSPILTENSPETVLLQNARKSAHRKKHKHQSINVYRTLRRADSRCSVLTERDITNDEMILLANSFIVDHIPLSPSSGYFRPQNLPNIQKHRINNNNSRIGSSHTKSSYLTSSSLRIQHVGHTRPTTTSPQLIHQTPPPPLIHQTPPPPPLHIIYPTTPPQLMHRTSPVDREYEENDNEMAIGTTMITTPILETRTRKELHVYMPQIFSC